MGTYKIAGVTVEILNDGEILRRRGKDYEIYSEEKPDVEISLSEDFIKLKQSEEQNVTVEECRYFFSGSAFYKRLLDYDGFVLHASAVALDGKAFLFSAKSGTGKSTHTRLWQKHFGSSRAFIINDDKPAIRLINDKFYCFGTPWSGKSHKNINIKVPVGSIVFIEQSDKNWIKEISSQQAVKLILQYTLRPFDPDKMDKLLFLIGKLLKELRVYKMGCNISEEAVEMAYNAIS